MRHKPLETLIPPCEVDRARRDKILAKPDPRLEFVIYFTARSGSTRVAEILSLTKTLGHGSELFNPNFMPKISEAFAAQTLDEFIRHGRKQHQTRGVFSFQITANHLEAVFEDPSLFFDTYARAPSYWLTRDNIVEQAVSLAKMVDTSVGHASISSAEEIEKADQSYAYDPGEIKTWLRHLILSELLMERYHFEFEVTPKRITYEQMSAMSTAEVADFFAQDILGEGVEIPEVPLKNLKIGTSRNTSYAERFRQDEPEYVALVEEARRRLRAGLQRQSEFEALSQEILLGRRKSALGAYVQSMLGRRRSSV